MSPCGTFALVGSVGGAIDMYNLQSGQHRQRFPSRLTPVEAKKLKLQQLQDEDDPFGEAAQGPPKFFKGQGRHKGAVTGLAVDGLNRVVISCSDDGKLKVSALAGITTWPDTDLLHSSGTSQTDY
jgi:U3 small nucleolar RNA-associated protein 21